MPIYISRGRFTSDAVKGMLAKPENREEAVAKLFRSVGGRLIGWYLTFGHHDWLVIGEFPDEKAAASAVLAAAAGGSLSEIETTVAMTAKDAASTFESAGKAAKDFTDASRFGRDSLNTVPGCRQKRASRRGNNHIGAKAPPGPKLSASKPLPPRSS
jgi:uncharacterized protein with GYD domain